MIFGPVPSVFQPPGWIAVGCDGVEAVRVRESLGGWVEVECSEVLKECLRWPGVQYLAHLISVDHINTLESEKF